MSFEWIAIAPPDAAADGHGAVEIAA